MKQLRGRGDKDVRTELTLKCSIVIIIMLHDEWKKAELEPQRCHKETSSGVTGRCFHDADAEFNVSEVSTAGKVSVICC